MNDWLDADRKSIQVHLLPPTGLLLQLRQARSGQELKPQAITRRSSNSALALLLSQVCRVTLKVSG
jgi:hypothetical protein